MSSTNRSRKGHQSTKIPNVKLRPAPAAASSSRHPTDDERDEQVGLMGPRQPRPRNGKGKERSHSPENLMNKALLNRLYDDSYDDPLLKPPQLPFSNLTITFTGLPNLKVSLSKILLKLGARKVESNLTVETGVLIADRAGFGGAKYLCALEHQIPIVTSEWITSTHTAWLQGEEVNARAAMEIYRLKPFEGLNIAVSGIEPLAKRKSLQAQIEHHGGNYSPNLDRTCTHLIVACPASSSISTTVPPAPSRKVQWALELYPDFPPTGTALADGDVFVHVVWEGWMWDCLAAGGRWAERRWDLRAKGVGVPKGESWVDKVAAKKAAEQARLEASLLAPTAQPLPENPDELIAVLKSEAPEPAVIRTQRKPELAGMGAGSRGKGKGRGEGLVADLLGAIKVEKEELTLAAANVEVKEEKTEKGGTAGVMDDGEESQGWKKRPRLALVASQDVKVAGSVTSSAGPSRLSAKAKLPSVLHSSRADAFTEEPMPLATEVKKEVKEAGPTTGRKEIDFDPKLFQGLVFSYITMDAGEGMVLEKALKSCGAVVRRWGEVAEDGKEGEVDYLVVRVANGPNPILPAGAKTQVVTECWVERCLGDKRICPAESNLMFKPLRGKMPIPGAGNMMIHLSGMGTEEIFYSKRLLRAFGANISASLTRNVTTHMIVSDITNERKIRKSLQWKIPVVKQEWLFAMAESGQVEPFEPFALDISGIEIRAASTPVPSAESMASKIRLSVDNTANLSVMTESIGGPFGGFKVAEVTSALESAPLQSQDASLKSSQGQRPLGLTPTELNIPAGSKGKARERDSGELSFEQGVLAKACPATERILNNSQSEEKPIIDSEYKDITPHLGKAMTVATSNPFKVPAGRKSAVMTDLQYSTVRPTLTGPIPDDLFEQLARVDASAEEQRQKPVRPTRRPGSGRNVSGFASRSVMQSGSPSRLSLNPTAPTDYHQAMDLDLEPHVEDGDESIRVQYMDPTAEKERKRLLDALTGGGESSKSKRRRGV